MASKGLIDDINQLQRSPFAAISAYCDMQLPISDSTFWLAYWTSNIGGAILAITGWKWVRIARYLFAALFGWASWFNLDTVASTPDVYLDYALLTPVRFYSDFITGWFADHVTGAVMTVAIGQGLIAIGMLLGKTWARIAAVGAMAFLLAVAPLGLGSAFPASLLMAVGAYFVYRGSASSA